MYIKKSVLISVVGLTLILGYLALQVTHTVGVKTGVMYTLDNGVREACKDAGFVRRVYVKASH